STLAAAPFDSGGVASLKQLADGETEIVHIVQRAAVSAVAELMLILPPLVRSRTDGPPPLSFPRRCSSSALVTSSGRLVVIRPPLVRAVISAVADFGRARSMSPPELSRLIFFIATPETEAVIE